MTRREARNLCERLQYYGLKSVSYHGNKRAGYSVSAFEPQRRRWLDSSDAAFLESFIHDAQDGDEAEYFRAWGEPLAMLLDRERQIQQPRI